MSTGTGWPVEQVTDVHDQVIEKAVTWYRHTRMPKAFRTAHPRVIEEVERICDGDWRRCVIEQDGSIVVHNRPVWH